MKTTSICRRCHRLKPTDLTRCCAGCRTELRAQERRRPTPEAPAASPEPKNALVFIEPNLGEEPIEQTV